MIFRIFHSVGNFIIPTDSYFSEGLKPPTRLEIRFISNNIDDLINRILLVITY